MKKWILFVFFLLSSIIASFITYKHFKDIGYHGRAFIFLIVSAGLIFVIFSVLLGVICKWCQKPQKRNVKEKVKTLYKPASVSCWFDCMNCLAGCLYYSPCSVTCLKGLTLENAIDRHSEYFPKGGPEIIEQLAEDKFLKVLLGYLNESLPKFYFKVLPSGSIREGFGKPFPSTSILATDYDLMLVPDGIFVYEDADIKEMKSEKQFPASFVATNNMECNPTTPNGFLWLRLKEKRLKEWKRLCFERLSSNRKVEYYLSQLAVYRTIKSALSNELFLKLVMIVLCDLKKGARQTVDVRRSGPALTVTFKQDDDVEFHADFTVALSSPKFPKCAQDFFKKRERVPCPWPPQEVVEKIRKLGCHVVPKPSEKTLVIFNKEQSEKSHLDQGTVLEWRYSFSQAEMLLSDYLPKAARKAYLAFKATVKQRINNKVDSKGEFHEVPSYVLKTILYRLVEKHPEEYWTSWIDISEMFFKELFSTLILCMKQKCCPHYWIPNINLLQDMNPEDFEFIQNKLDVISCDYVKFVADEWLEYQRWIRTNCCNGCVSEKVEEKSPDNVSRHTCCSIDLGIVEWNPESCFNCGGLPYEPTVLEVY